MSIGEQSLISMSDQLALPPASSKGDRPWEVAMLFPLQGEWTEDDFFSLESRSKRPMELVNGCLRLLPMPNEDHQAILSFLNDLFKAFVLSRGLGRIRFAPLPIRLGGGEIREPDLMFFRKVRPRGPKGYPDGVDLALEIVSEGSCNRARDLQEKREAYAMAGIPEYWIVDPKLQTITVLVLNGPEYREHGVFSTGQHATSLELPGFTVSVSDVFAAANE